MYKRQTPVVFSREVMATADGHHLSTVFFYPFWIFVLESYFVHDINDDYHKYFNILFL